MADSITAEELLADPEPTTIPVRTRDRKSGKIIEKELRVFPRRPTDIEREMCQSSANAARRTQRKLLMDPKTDEHRLLLREPLEDAEPEVLRQLWVSGQLLTRVAEMQLQSLEEREYIEEPEGDIVPPKVRDDYDESVEAAENDRVTNLVKAIDAARRELEAEALLIPAGALLDNAMPKHVETIVQRTWNDVYTANLIARCTFADKNYAKPYFKTVSQVESLRTRQPAVYQKLADTHRGLLLEMEPTLGNWDARRPS